MRTIPRFLAVGALGTIIDLGLFTVLHVLLGLPALAANAISYSAGIVNNYILHRNWTYTDRPRRAVSVQFAEFTLVSLSALLLNSGIVLLLVQPLGALLANPAYGSLLAKSCATCVGLGWNLLANSIWTFRSPEKGTP